MTTLDTKSIKSPACWVQIGFLTATVLFNLCLAVQLLTVGLAVFQGPEWWTVHVWLVRGFSGLAMLLLGWAFFSPFPQRVQRLAGGLVVLLGLQFLTIHLPLVSVLHPLTGFMLFTVSSTLVHRAWHVAFTKADEGS